MHTHDENKVMQHMSYINEDVPLHTTPWVPPMVRYPTITTINKEEG